MVDEVEDWSQHLIHALHVLRARVHLGKDEQYPGHIVVAVGASLFRLFHPALHELLVLTVDHLPLFLPGWGHKGDQDGFDLSRKEGQFRLSAGGVFLDLFPQVEVLLVVLPLRVLFVHDERVVLEPTGRQVVLNKIKIVLLLFCVLVLPTGPGPWQVAQNNFPTGLSKSVCLIRNSIGQIDS